MGTVPARARARGAIRALVFVSTAFVILSAAACGDGEGSASRAAPTTPVANRTAVPGADERAMLEGTLTLDGAPLEAQFVGARVVRDGMAAACQHTIPAIAGGRYAIQVVSDAEVTGCGAPGAEIVLWTFVNERFLFSSRSTPWPGNGGTATFDASFSSASPLGASKRVTEFKGHLFDRDGRGLPSGTVVEAYAGDIPCGVTSLRYGNDVEGFYTLIVAGPESIADCAQDATLTFLLDGDRAAETAVNDLASGGEGHELDLTVQ